MSNQKCLQCGEEQHNCQCTVFYYSGRPPNPALLLTDKTKSAILAETISALLKELGAAEAQLARLEAMFSDCFDHSDEKHFRAIAEGLMGTSGEGWSIGNLVNKILDWRLSKLRSNP